MATTIQDAAEALLNLLFSLGEGNVEAVNSSTAVTISTPEKFSTTVLTLNGATPAITLPAPTVAGERKRIYLVQDATGSRIPSWASVTGSITWLQGAPVLSTTAAAVDRVEFESTDGVNWTGTATLANTGNIPVKLTPTLVSGTALQDTTGQWSTWYIQISAGSAGTFACAIGPSNSVSDAIMPTEDAVTAHTHTVRLPPSWFIRATVSTSTIVGVTQITG